MMIKREHAIAESRGRVGLRRVGGGGSEGVKFSGQKNEIFERKHWTFKSHVGFFFGRSWQCFVVFSFSRNLSFQRDEESTLLSNRVLVLESIMEV